ncbi:ABC transporter permease [Gracilibacillus caseinilyticus]|uniref:ABC transporter permease n=1 Tax=Gracilibacillus caseinilyticus TaxID=2932256 RepID=A0ABY4F0U9_9BACI|nr:ABC transporter permease subunit [Gracilibacillus caseinilyticus]UOQ49712.1 ABC transporter permease [Gracilibacillus caseinilyticus]
MVHILWREFTDSFKSIRSILIILFLTFISYQSAVFLENNPVIVEEILAIGETQGSVYTLAISFIVLMFGFLFAFAISHDVINKEIEMRTIRLLVNKIPRWQIVIGKFFGILLFWVVTIFISYAILTAISGEWSFLDYLTTLLFLFYVISFVLFISTIIPKTKLTMFLGILLGLFLPIMGLVSLTVEKWYMIPFKYLLPYYYVENGSALLPVPLLFGIVFLFVSILIMRRRDL